MTQRTHRIIAAVAALGFLVVVQIFSSPTPVFRFLVPSFFGYLVLVSTYNYGYLKSLGKFDFWIWFRVVLFLCAWFGFFFLVPTSVLQGLFLLVSLGLIYFFEISLGKVGEQVLFNQVLLTSFAFFMFVAAFSSYFPLPSALYFLALSLFVLLLCRASFELTPASATIKWVGAIVLAVLVTEVFWSMSFLPLHYSVLGLLLFNFFYLAWVLYYYHLFKLLTQRKVQFQIGLFLGFTLVVLLATRFLPPKI